MSKIEVIGQMDGIYELSNRVYSRTGISPTITTNYGGDKVPYILEVKKMDEIQVIGQMDNSIDHTFESCNRVYGIGGVADLNYPDSKTRRGRVIENGEISPTLTTENIPNVLEPWIWEVDGERYLIRIRKLTPRECWQLMDFSDEDFDKAQAVNSNTQLYKQAGNSIVKNVLCEVFRQLIE